MKLECAHADTCYSDYWGGHHLPHVVIFPLPTWTARDIREAIKNELRQGAVMGSTSTAWLLSADYVDPGEEKDADRATRAAYAAVNRIRTLKRRPFADMPDESDHDSIGAYFVFREV